MKKRVLCFLLFWLVNVSKGDLSSTAFASESDSSLPIEETAPVERVTQSYEMAFTKTIVVLSVLIALLILAVWMVKKVSSGRLRSFNNIKLVKILERRPLSPKSMLYIVEVEGKKILIAESHLSVNQITTLERWGEKKDL